MKRRLQSQREVQPQEIQSGRARRRKAEEKARMTSWPKLEVLKVGGCSRDAFKKAREYSRSRHVMTVAEISEYLKVRRITIYRWVRKGKIPAFKIGTDWYFDSDAIEKLMIDRQVNG
jgi:excisionase family DNA binding protein